MASVSSEKSRHLKDILNLVSFLANHPGVPVKTVCGVFGLTPRELMRALNEILMVGLPPYGPSDYVTAWMENGAVSIVNAGLLRRPLNLTLAEAVSLKTIVRDFLGQSPGALEEPASSLAGKIDRLLGLAGPKRKARPAGNRTIHSLQRAADHSKVARILYYNRSEDVLSERLVEPLAIIAVDGVWYLLAFCRLKGSERTFRIDRVKSVEVLSERFKRPADFDVERYRRDEMFFPSGREQAVRIRFAPESARWAAERFAKWIVASDAGGTLCEFRVADFGWACDVVAEFAPDATIAGPASARAALAARVSEVLRLYR